MAIENEALSETARRESEIFAKFKNALKDKRLVIIVGAEITLSAIANISGIPFSRLTWTDLIRNNLDYLIINSYVNVSNYRTRLAYAIFKETDTDSLLNTANIMIGQLEKHR